MGLGTVAGRKAVLHTLLPAMAINITAAPKRLRPFSTPKASISPTQMGRMMKAFAVVLGLRGDRAKLASATARTMFLGLHPIDVAIVRAILLPRPLASIPLASTKPLRIIQSPLLPYVPKSPAMTSWTSGVDL